MVTTLGRRVRRFDLSRGNVRDVFARCRQHYDDWIARTKRVENANEIATRKPLKRTCCKFEKKF